MKLNHLYVGCCGFPMAKERYFKLFDIVEIQKTFYELSSEEIGRII